MSISSLLFFPLVTFFISKADIHLPSESYQQVCNEIIASKAQKDSSELKSYFISSYYEVIFPFWKGTEWDYEGYTNKPKEGVIACGYFVSTPLKHMGMNWNRYKLAQMYSSKSTDILCESIHTFRDINKLYKYIKEGPDNIYHLGLSFHVGLIIKYKGKIKFLHSDYIGRSGVKEENILDSQALRESSIYYIGTLTHPKLLMQWKNGTEIKF